MAKRPSSAEELPIKRPRELPKALLAGSSGIVLNLLANFYRVSLQNAVFQHDLKFDPPVEARRLCGGLLRNIIEDIGEFIPAGEMLFLRKMVNLEKDTESRALPGKESQKYHISIRFVKKREDNETFYAFNMLFKKLMRGSNFEQMGDAYFDPASYSEVSGGSGSFFVLSGFKTALARTTSGLLLNAELKSKAVWKETVYEFILRNTKSKQEAHALLEGRSVIARYNNKAYRISEINYTLSPSKTTFVNKKTGQPITVLDYMRERYPNVAKGIDPNQPLLVYIPKRSSTGYKGEPVYLIPQLCVLTGLTKEWREDFRMMETFNKKTLIEPQQRFVQIGNLISGFADPKLIEQAQLNAWNLEVRAQPVEVMGRRLEPEKLVMKNNSKNDATVTNFHGEWTPHKQDLKFYFVPGNKVQWAYLYPKDLGFKLNSFKDTFCSISQKAGMNLENPLECALERTSGEDYYAALQQLKPTTLFVLCVLPGTAEDRYNKIKSAYCSAVPVISQCVVHKTLTKNEISVCTKLAFQIAAKVGGAPWILKDSGLTDSKKTMIIGIDVSHNRGKPSTVAMVASMNNLVSKFYSRVYQMPTGSQNITQLGSFIRDSFTEYKKQNKVFPMSLIVYRDGLGESQIGTTGEAEYKQIVESLAQGKVVVHEIIFIVVQKRVDARFALKQGQTLENAPSGTVVDTGVVASRERHEEKGTLCDFYLIGQSHKKGNKNAPGTMNPAHYWVRHSNPEDENSMKIDQIEILTYKLCHLYYNWSGTVSAPALCKYAKILATLAGKSLPNTDLHTYHHNLLAYI